MNTDVKLVSIIVPCFKKFEYFFTSLDSIFIQDYEKIELLVCDDCSPNFKYEIVDEYIRTNKKNNIVQYDVQSNSVNLGTVKNINSAIKRSTGEYIITLSCDDCFYDAQVVRKIVDKLDQSENGIIACRRVMCDERLNPIRLMPPNSALKRINSLNTAEQQHKAFALGEFYELASGSCTYYTRKRLFEDGLYNEKYRLLEDLTHFLEITRKYKIETAYDLVAIKYRAGGISSTFSPTIINDYLLAMNEEKNTLSLDDSSFYKRYIDFNIKRFKNKKNYITYFKYIDIFFARTVYKIRATIYSRLK